MSQPQIVLITGASSGIGAALARRYAAEGKTLVISGRNQERLTIVAQECRECGAVCDPHVLDVSDVAALADWLERILDTYPIDLAILNAGLAATRSSVEDGERLSEIVAQVDVNLRGTLIAAQLIGRAMVERRSGHIALISSLNGLFPVVEAPTYSATKAAIVAYGRAASDWLKPFGVGVSTICPGFVRTAIAERYSGPRPLEIGADEAAGLIVNGIDSGKEFIAFPWQLVFAIRVGKFLPAGLRRSVLARYTSSLSPL